MRSLFTITKCVPRLLVGWVAVSDWTCSQTPQWTPSLSARTEKNQMRNFSVTYFWEHSLPGHQSINVHPLFETRIYWPVGSYMQVRKFLSFSIKIIKRIHCELITLTVLKQSTFLPLNEKKSICWMIQRELYTHKNREIKFSWQIRTILCRVWSFFQVKSVEKGKQTILIQIQTMSKTCWFMWSPVGHNLQ